MIRLSQRESEKTVQWKFLRKKLRKPRIYVSSFKGSTKDSKKKKKKQTVGKDHGKAH